MSIASSSLLALSDVFNFAVPFYAVPLLQFSRLGHNLFYDQRCQEINAMCQPVPHFIVYPNMLAAKSTNAK